MVIDKVSIATEVANPEEKNADHLVSPLGLSTEYYPFKRCYVPMGHSVYERNTLPNFSVVRFRGELSYLAPLGSENISAPYFKQCFVRGGGYYPPPPPDSQTPRLPVPRQKQQIFYFIY